MSQHEREGEEEVRVPSSVLVWCYMPFSSFYTFSLSLSPSLKLGSQSGGRPRSSSVGAGNRAGVLEMTSQSESEEYYGGETGVNQGQWFIPSLHS